MKKDHGLMQLYQSAANGKLDQFGAGMHVKFMHDALTVAGDRLGAECKLQPDLLVI